MSVGLSVLLLLRASRGVAQENHVDYRHEFYGEDDHRMKIDTDSALFDVGLGSHVRVNGEYVVDAISGASPNGAPPQSQWPFPKYSDFYQKSLSQLFQAAVNDPNNLVLYQSGYFASYHDYTNYVASSNPQLPMQATNSANASYQALTNNPSMRNTKVPLTNLSDHREALSFSVPITFGIHQFTPEISYSKEHDYHSYGFALNYGVQLNEKNTTLNLGWGRNSDRVRDDQFNWQQKVSDDFFIGVNQLLTPKSYVTFNFTYGTEFGYLSDPYRGVMAMSNFLQNNPSDPALIPEKRPRHRTKIIAYTSYNQFIDPLNGSVELGYRFFHDSSEIFAHTIEADWHQKIGKHLVISPSFRYYNQSAADFYYVMIPDYNNRPSFYSADYRLSRLQSFTFSASLTYRIQKHVSVDLSYMRYFMRGLDGVTSQSAYPAANVYSVGARLWF